MTDWVYLIGSTAVIALALYALYRASVRIRVLEGELADCKRKIEDAGVPLDWHGEGVVKPSP